MGQTKVYTSVLKFIIFAGFFGLSSCSLKGEITKFKSLRTEVLDPIEITPIAPKATTKGAFMRSSLCDQGDTQTAGGFKIRQSCSGSKEQIFVTASGYKVFQGTTAQIGSELQ